MKNKQPILINFKKINSNNFQPKVIMNDIKSDAKNLNKDFRELGPVGFAKKNKLTTFLTAGLALTTVVAVAAPIGISVTNNSKLKNLQDQNYAVQNKTIAAELRAKEAFDKIKLSKSTPEEALIEVNKYVDKNELFSVVNENGIEIKNALAGQTLGTATIISDDSNIYISIPLTWNNEKDYILPPGSQKSGKLWFNYSVTQKTDFNSIINQLDLSTVDPENSPHTSLQALLNSPDGKAKITNSINNSDKIVIDNVTVAPANANGFAITIPYKSKPEYRIPDSSLIVSNFKIKVKTPTLKSNANDILLAIPGIKELEDYPNFSAFVLRNSEEFLKALDDFNSIISASVSPFDLETTGIYRLNYLYKIKDGIYGFDVDGDQFPFDLNINP